jgi:hypothetical protein
VSGESHPSKRATCAAVVRRNRRVPADPSAAFSRGRGPSADSRIPLDFSACQSLADPHQPILNSDATRATPAVSRGARAVSLVRAPERARRAAASVRLWARVARRGDVSRTFNHRTNGWCRPRSSHILKSAAPRRRCRGVPRAGFQPAIPLIGNSAQLELPGLLPRPPHGLPVRRPLFPAA